MISCCACLRLESRIRRKCGSSSTMSIFPIASFLNVRAPRKFDRKTHSAGRIASEHDLAAVGSNDIACDREPETITSLLGGKQRFENSIDALLRYRTGRIDYINPDRPRVAVLLGVQMDSVSPPACVDCVNQQIQKRLLNLGWIKVGLKILLRFDIDRHTFACCV